jgi:hypothetical protein
MKPKTHKVRTPRSDRAQPTDSDEKMIENIQTEHLPEMQQQHLMDTIIEFNHDGGGADNGCLESSSYLLFSPSGIDAQSDCFEIVLTTTTNTTAKK